MPTHNPPASHHKPTLKKRRKLKDVDWDSPNDKAFYLVSAPAVFFLFFQRSHFPIVNATSMTPSPQTLPRHPHFHQASSYGLPYKKAMQLSGATCSERGLRRRFKRFFKRQDRENGFASDQGDVVPSPDSLVPSSPSRDLLVPSPPSTGNAQQLADSSMAPRGECGLSLDVSTKPTRASARIYP